MLHRSLHPRRALRAPPAAPAASALSALHPAPARPAAGGTGSPQPVPRAARSARGLVLRLGLGCCRTDHRGDTRHHSGWRPSCRRHRFPPGLARPSGNRSSESADLRKLGGATLCARVDPRSGHAEAWLGRCVREAVPNQGVPPISWRDFLNISPHTSWFTKLYGSHFLQFTLHLSLSCIADWGFAQFLKEIHHLSFGTFVFQIHKLLKNTIFVCQI